MSDKYDLAQAELKNGLDIRKTNLPINVREGRTGQARLEQESIKSFQAAIKALDKASKKEI